jgi:hypothetical protein
MNFIMPKRISAADVEEIQMGRMRQYLRKKGWTESSVIRRPVGRKSEPIPWYSYPCTHFLASRATADMDVFEFGSGHSTLWWAKRVRSVTSCEHDRAFYEEISANAPDNVTYVLPEPSAYAATAGIQQRKFDVIVIDGQDRVACGMAAIEGLKPDGVIIWDNADRDLYKEGYAFLLDLGFRRLDFHGHGPIWIKEWSTTIFYRDGNCLGI